MTATVDTLNSILALGGIGLLATSAILLFDLYTERTLRHYIERYAILAAFILTTAGSAMTLIYSELFGFVPCGLCWLQRVFLYPQVFVTGVALWAKDKTVALYGIALSIPGLIVALYQHYLQLGGDELVGCPTAGAGADCAKRIMFEFGFMTFPLLSASLFVFLIVLFWYYYQLTKKAR